MILNRIFKKLKKIFFDLFSYPRADFNDVNYEKYWAERACGDHDLNNFQRIRAKIVIDKINDGSSLLDVGCGNGSILRHILGRKNLSKAMGLDFSESVLGVVNDEGLNILKLDLNKIKDFKVDKFDYILMFEILEHLASSEDVLTWSVANSNLGVFLSVPNTGFITHRIRLLMGRFPLQWRIRPSEHLRFWTVKDMHWWLKSSGYDNYDLRLYEGIPVLNKIWPNLFAEGIFVYIGK
jgi:methionine biosynthesis protein MetW